MCSVTVLSAGARTPQKSEVVQEPPEGYYAFVESPNAEPPRVRRPPYHQSDKECPGSCVCRTYNPRLHSVKSTVSQVSVK
jgi:hypothetical protein